MNYPSDEDIADSLDQKLDTITSIVNNRSSIEGASLLFTLS